MHFLRISLSVLFVSAVFFLHAQQGIVRGTVFDDATGEYLPGVSILAEGTTTGTLTDLDGKFNLVIEPGTYNIRVSFISYQTIVVSDVVVKDGDVNVLKDLRLLEETFDLNEVVITAQATRNTETALLTIKKKSANVIDGISNATFKKTGDSDAASSIKRVPGISVEGGKYVFVRGLGDRYTKTILNGLDIPGLDPDRNTLQIDIFPTNIIDNILVYKSFTADLPADFTGGVIDINLRDFPERKKASISVAAQYNPNMHFNSNNLIYHGGGLDWLGMDDGTRDIPATENIPAFIDVLGNPTSTEGQRFREILEGFNPNLAAFKKMSFMDYSLSASFGNQFVLPKVTLGYDVALSYRNITEFFEGAIFARYGLKGDPDSLQMEMREFQEGDYGTNAVLWNAMAGFAVKTQKSKFRLTFLHIQNGESEAGIFDYQGNDQGSVFDAFQHNLAYGERTLTNALLAGKHSFPTSKWTIEWKVSPTRSILYEPDIRFTRYRVDQGNLTIGTESGFPERIWRDLEEVNLGSVAHVTKEFDINDNAAKLQFGGGYTFKERDYVIYNYALNLRSVPLTGDPNELFWDENLWTLGGYPPTDPANNTKGTTYEARFIPNNPNQFNSKVNAYSAYVQFDFFIVKKLKTIIGVRMENYVQRYTGTDQLLTRVLDNDVVLDDLDFFPTLNLIYNINNRMNLRFSFASTIARPSFKELSYAEIYDPITGRTFVGGLFEDANRDPENPENDVVYWDGNLVSTNILNFDLRWEFFQEGGRMFSLSAFYKSFDKPIEIVQYATQTGSFQPRNVGDGELFGGELEFRQNFEFISEAMSFMSIVANFSYIYSRIEMSPTEYESRVNNARTGQTIDRYREMAGQAPYLINIGLTYAGQERGWWNGFEAGLFYNVQGPTLIFVGIVDRPDIYTNPFNSLNLNLTKAFGKDQRYQVGLRISNMLNDVREEVFQSFGSSDEYFTRLAPGYNFRLRFQATLF
jgi:hypothetical protein